MRSAALLTLFGALALPLAAQLATPRGILDHSICCGTKPASLDGAATTADHWAALLLPTALPAETPAVSAPPDPARTTFSSANASAKAAVDAPLEMVSGYARVGFDRLADFALSTPATPLPANAPQPDVLAQVPAAIKRLDGKKVLVTGFMLPVKVEKGLATEFLLLASSQLCCYGIVPAPNQWISVKMRKEGLPPVQDTPIPLAGRLRVRAQWQDGLLNGIYEMEGDGLLKPPAKPAR